MAFFVHYYYFNTKSSKEKTKTFFLTQTAWEFETGHRKGRDSMVIIFLIETSFPRTKKDLFNLSLNPFPYIICQIFECAICPKHFFDRLSLGKCNIFSINCLIASGHPLLK
jgi:hypothetical protein